jgi:hypothetical protein
MIITQKKSGIAYQPTARANGIQDLLAHKFGTVKRHNRLSAVTASGCEPVHSVAKLQTLVTHCVLHDTAAAGQSV